MRNDTDWLDCESNELQPRPTPLVRLGNRGYNVDTQGDEWSGWAVVLISLAILSLFALAFIMGA